MYIFGNKRSVETASGVRLGIAFEALVGPGAVLGAGPRPVRVEGRGASAGLLVSSTSARCAGLVRGVSFWSVACLFLALAFS